MSERLSVPIEYTGKIGPNSMLTPDPENLFPIQDLSSQVLKSNRFFQNKSDEDKAVAIQALSILGAYAIPMTEGNWRSMRWAQMYGELEVTAGKVIREGVNHTSEPLIRKGFRDFCHLMESGAESIDQLQEIRRNGLHLEADVSFAARNSAVEKGITAHFRRARH